MDCSLPGSSVHGILQAHILEWIAMPSSRDLPNPGIELVSLMSTALACGFFCFFFVCLFVLPLVPPGKPTESLINSIIFSLN